MSMTGDMFDEMAGEYQSRIDALEATVQRLTEERDAAREWWNRQGRFLAPREGDDAAWDEYTRRPIPEWVVAAVTPGDTKE